MTRILVLQVLGAILVGLGASRPLAAQESRPIAVGDSVVIASPSANLMLGERVLATIPAGTSLRVSDIEGNWIGVLTDGRSGWVRREQITLAGSGTPGLLPRLGSPLSIDDSKVQGVWSVKDAIVRTLDDDYFTETDGLAIVRITRNEGNRLMAVQFELTALSADPAAVDELVRRRDWSEGRRNRLREEVKGDFRYFDMNAFALVDSVGNRYEPRWCLTKAGTNEYQAPENQLIVSPAPDPSHWKQTSRKYRVFDGLLEANRPVQVSLLFRVPAGAEVSSLKLQPEPVSAEATTPTVPAKGATAKSG